MSADSTPRFGYHSEMTYTDKGIYLNAYPEQLYPWASDLEVGHQFIANDERHIGSEYHKLQTLYINGQVKGAN